MEYKIKLKLEEQVSPQTLVSKIMNDVTRGFCPTWDIKKIAIPNKGEKSVIFHSPASGQCDEPGKDVCFGFIVNPAEGHSALLVRMGLLSNWCASPDIQQQQYHVGRLVSLLLSYKPYFCSMQIY